MLTFANLAQAIIGDQRGALGDLRIMVVGGTGAVLPFLESIDNASGDVLVRAEQEPMKEVLITLLAAAGVGVPLVSCGFEFGYRTRSETLGPLDQWPARLRSHYFKEQQHFKAVPWVHAAVWLGKSRLIVVDDVLDVDAEFETRVEGQRWRSSKQCAISRSFEKWLSSRSSRLRESSTHYQVGLESPTGYEPATDGWEY